MTAIQRKKIARPTLSLLQLAGELRNLSKACKIVGYRPQQFYEICRNFQLYGAVGLIDQLPGVRGPHQHRVSEDVEKGILEHALEHPTHGPQRVTDAVKELGLKPGRTPEPLNPIKGDEIGLVVWMGVIEAG